jgi:hypothetical protein
MKCLLRGFIVVTVIVFVFAAARMGDQQANAQIQKPVPLPLKPDYVPEVKVTLQPSVLSTDLVKNGGSYVNGPAYCWMLIKNDGLADATHASKFKYTIYLNDKEVKNIPDGNLATGVKKGKYEYTAFTMPANQFGKWKIVFSVDTANDIAESNENNNSVVFTCTCQKLY